VHRVVAWPARSGIRRRKKTGMRDDPVLEIIMRKNKRLEVDPHEDEKRPVL
jgi:hypothetical protein